MFFSTSSESLSQLCYPRSEFYPQEIYCIAVRSMCQNTLKAWTLVLNIQNTGCALFILRAGAVPASLLCGRVFEPVTDEPLALEQVVRLANAALVTNKHAYEPWLSCSGVRVVAIRIQYRRVTDHPLTPPTENLSIEQWR